MIFAADKELQRLITVLYDIEICIKKSKIKTKFFSLRLFSFQI